VYGITVHVQVKCEAFAPVCVCVRECMSMCWYVFWDALPWNVDFLLFYARMKDRERARETDDDNFFFMCARQIQTSSFYFLYLTADDFLLSLFMHFAVPFQFIFIYISISICFLRVSRVSLFYFCFMFYFWRLDVALPIAIAIAIVLCLFVVCLLFSLLTFFNNWQHYSLLLLLLLLFLLCLHNSTTVACLNMHAISTWQSSSQFSID